MRDVLILFVHLIVTVARLAGPSGLRSVVAESVLVRHPGTAPLRIALLHGNDSIDEVLVRSLRTRAAPAFGREQEAVLSFAE